MAVVRLAGRITPFHIRERARLYRFAAALADAPREIAMFRDLAITFEQVARQFGQAGAPRVTSSRSIDVTNDEMSVRSSSARIRYCSRLAPSTTAT